MYIYTGVYNNKNNNPDNNNSIYICKLLLYIHICKIIRRIIIFKYNKSVEYTMMLIIIL